MFNLKINSNNINIFFKKLPIKFWFTKGKSNSQPLIINQTSYPQIPSEKGVGFVI